MKIPMLMTPGPTYIAEEVRQAMARAITNPDLDENFFEFYLETTRSLQHLLKTKNDILILAGEGILGLEAACASLIEPGERILCIDNGIYGRGFGEFAKLYGGDVVYFQGDYRRAIDPEALEAFLAKDHAFKIATVVHCETPSGITNPVNLICPLLKKYGIISVVDSVSAIGGEEVKVDEWQMDLVIGGSQKCLSAAPGLTFLSLSELAWHKVLSRKAPVAGFYTNLGLWRHWYQDKWFPYTQSISDIYGLKTAVDRLLAEDDFVSRHQSIGEKVRKALVDAGLELYPLSGYANTVTTILVPDGLSFANLYRGMLEDHNIMIAGGFDFLQGKVFRLGHMGENCRSEKIHATMTALDKTLGKLHFAAKKKLSEGVL